MATALAYEVAWKPQSLPQEALLACPIEDVFYGGARGGGKTDGELGDFASHAGQYGKHARGILFRRTYPELEEVERRAREIYGPLGWDYNETKKTWTAPDGATLKLRYLKRDSDADSYQGHSYTWQGWDELTNWASPIPVDKLWATLRSPAGVPCVRRSTGNPGGPGHGWVKRRYIDHAPQGYQPFRWAPNPEAPDLTIESVFIPSLLDDNPLIAASGYEARIAAATAGDAALWRAWRFGEWDVFVGQMYAAFRQATHVIRGKGPDAFPAYTEWFATMDWGFNRGCYGLHAVDRERNVELVGEFYDGFTNLHAEQAAHAIVAWHTRAGWPLPKIIHFDEQMNQRVGTSQTLIEEFRKGLAAACGENAPACRAAKHPPGSREVKVALIQGWLAVPESGVPHYRIHERCKNTIRVLTEIPRDPDNPNDVDPDYSDDHPHDMVGFAVASRPHPATNPVLPTIEKDRHPGWQWGKNGRLEKKHIPHAADPLDRPMGGRGVPRARTPNLRTPR